MLRRIFPALLAVLIGMPVVTAHAVDAPWISSLVVKPLGIKSVSAFSDGTAYFFQQAEEGEGLQGFTSDDFGLTWTPLPSLPKGGGVRVDFVTPALGFATTGNHVVRTLDGGLTWHTVVTPWPGMASSDFVTAGSDGRTIAIGAEPWRDPAGHPWGGEGESSCHDPRKDRLQLFTSDDASVTWRKSTVYRRFPVTSDAADFLDARTGVVVVGGDIRYEKTGPCDFSATYPAGRRVLLTKNGGRSFHNIYTCPAGDGCLAVAMPSDRHIVVGATSGRLSVSFDGGKSFRRRSLDGLVEAPTIRDDYRWVYDLDFASVDIGYAVTNGRGLWRTVDGGLTWTREPSALDVPGMQGPGFGRVAAADDEHAIAVGPTFVLTRFP